MITLVPVYSNTSSVYVSLGYSSKTVIANQVFGGPSGYGSVWAVIGPSLVQHQGPPEAIYARVINDGPPCAVSDGSGSGGHGDCCLMTFGGLNYALLRQLPT